MPRIVPSLDMPPRDNLRIFLSAAIVISELDVGAEIFVPTALAIFLHFALRCSHWRAPEAPVLVGA